MDLSPFGLFLYLLIVVSLYTSPITIGVLAYGFYKGFFLKALAGIAVALPLTAMCVQFTVYVQDKAEVREYEEQQRQLEKMFDATLRGQLINGSIVGVETRFEQEYTRYQFPIEAFAPEVLDILGPPADINSAAWITLASPQPPVENAQLMIHEPTVYKDSAGDSPAEHFEKFFPELAPGLTGERVLMLHLLPRSSQITYYAGAEAKYPWRTQTAYLDWESFGDR